MRLIDEKGKVIGKGNGKVKGFLSQPEPVYNTLLNSAEIAQKVAKLEADVAELKQSNTAIRADLGKILRQRGNK